MKFRKKPVVIEAIKWEGQQSWSELQKLAVDTSTFGLFMEQDGSNNTLAINTLEGRMKVNVGDWIIKGIAGEFYPCKPDIFEKTYEAV